MNCGFDIIIIRGAPGIGKTTLGELLKISEPSNIVIDIDEIRYMIHGEKFTYGANKDYFNSILAVCELADFLFRKKIKPIFIIDVFSKVALDFFLFNIKNKNILITTLISNDTVLVKRMANRSRGYINIEVAKKVNQSIQEISYKSHIMIDTTLLNPKEVLFKLLTALAGNLV